MNGRPATVNQVRDGEKELKEELASGNGECYKNI